MTVEVQQPYQVENGIVAKQCVWSSEIPSTYIINLNPNILFKRKVWILSEHKHGMLGLYVHVLGETI